MAPPVEINFPDAAFWCHTENRVRESSYVWTIDNFSLMDNLTSPSFSVDEDNTFKWCLLIYPYGNGKTETNYVSLYLQVNSTYPRTSNLTISYRFGILDDKGVMISSSYFNQPQANIFRFGKTDGKCGYDNFITRSTILGSNGTRFLFKDKLTIICHIKYVTDFVDNSGARNAYKFEIPECEIYDELGHLLKTGRLCDVTFDVDGQDFKAHKAILGARSSVFAEIFEHDVGKLGDKNHRFIIKNVDPEIFNEMLNFVYTNKSLIIETMANKLLVAAGQYGLERLKIMCSEVLYKYLKIETAIETLILADEQNSNELKSQTIKFINQHASSIMNTLDWKDIIVSHPYLVAEICHELTKK